MQRIHHRTFENFHKQTIERHQTKRNRMHPEKRVYLWVVARLPNNTPCLYGAFTNREDAEKRGMQCNTPYEIVELPTRDENTAKHLWAAKGLNEGYFDGLEDATKRQRHKIQDQEITNG